MFSSFVTWLGDTFSSMGEAIISVLPKSPFVYIEMIPEVSQVMGIVNYFIPISAMLSILQVWLVAVAGWYVGMVVMRWFNVVS